MDRKNPQNAFDDLSAKLLHDIEMLQVVFVEELDNYMPGVFFLETCLFPGKVTRLHLGLYESKFCISGTEEGKGGDSVYFSFLEDEVKDFLHPDVLMSVPAVTPTLLKEALKQKNDEALTARLLPLIEAMKTGGGDKTLG